MVCRAQVAAAFPPAGGSSRPHWWLVCVCVSHASDCCPSLGTTHHNCCTFLVPLGLQEALRLEPSWAFTTWGTFTQYLQAAQALRLCALSDVVLWSREAFVSPHVVLCHRSIHSSADASASGDMLREEGRSAVGSGCMAGQPLAGFPLPAQTASAGSTCLAAHLRKGLSPPGVLALEAAAGCSLIGDRWPCNRLGEAVFSIYLAFCLKYSHLMVLFIYSNCLWLVSQWGVCLSASCQHKRVNLCSWNGTLLLSCCISITPY